VKTKIRKRVKITHSQLYHILVSNDQQNAIPKNLQNKFLFFGTVISIGKGKSTWNVKLDILPTNNNVVNNITRTKLTVVEDGEEEKGIPDDALLDDAEYNSDKDDGNPEQCYLLLITSATEIVSGVENFWKQGPSAG
jgi:hypothetical protein